MWQSLHDAWWRLATQSHPRSFSDALACRVLATGALAYRAAVTLRNAAYDQGWVSGARLPCRVVSVGNLTVGGTGKTACVELIAKKLVSLGRRVAILSRGYGGPRGAYWLRWEGGALVVNGERAGGQDGLADEPQLLARHLDGIPVVVGSQRTHSGRFAYRTFHADAVVLDDGFQHRQVQRDCEIVLVHARMPLDGWALLPRGPMREPVSSIRRADVIIVTKADEALERLGALSERLRALNPRASVVTAVHAPATLEDARTGARADPDRLSGLRVALISSIGDPEGFEATVHRLHATVLWHRAYPDHHPYQAADWAAIVRESQGRRPDAMVTTEKDWVRLRPWTVTQSPEPVPLWVLGVRMQLLEGEEVLDDRLARLHTG